MIADSSPRIDAFTNAIGLTHVQWRQVRSANQYVTLSTYSIEVADKIARFIKDIFGLAATDEIVRTHPSRQSGHRVIIRDFPRVAGCLDAYEEQMQAKITQMKESADAKLPDNAQEALFQLKKLCDSSWYEEKLRIGKGLKEKFPCLEPECFVTLDPLEKPGWYLLKTESEYSDPEEPSEDNVNRQVLLSEQDIQFINNKFFTK